MNSIRRFALGSLVVGLVPLCLAADFKAPPEWTQAQKPVHIFGNTYYVGTRGLTSILITSQQGHILIDGTMPEAATGIAANIRTLGFRAEDVKLILNTHVHFDHAGGIARLQKLSGATVAASPSSAKVLESGASGKDDPQYGQLPTIAHVTRVKVVGDGEILKVGPLAVTAHFTPGHTPGGTSWSWKTCELNRCLDIVYADSLNPVAAKGYLFTDTARQPNGVKQFEKSYEILSDLPCDILIAPHPELVDFFGKVARQEQGAEGEPTNDAFVDVRACKRYVADGRAKLEQRIAEEQAAKKP